MLFQKWRNDAKKKEEIPLEDVVKKIQAGDAALKEDLIKDYQPFVKKVVSKVCKRFIDQTMDEFSIGLLAFDQAINQYKEDQGSKFLTFADVVIRRRVIDFIRKEARRNKNEWLDHPDLEGEDGLEESLVQQKAAIETYETQQLSQTRMEQIEDYQLKLNAFDITFADLTKHCPKHVDARENAKQVAYILANNDFLSKNLLEKKQLPTKELLNFVTCSRKTIERNRKYIIAIALIYLGDFSALKSYIEPENMD